jgi:hypothetical protein
MYLIIQVKNRWTRKEKEDGAFHWLICVDGSEKGVISFKQTLKLANLEKDTIQFMLVKMVKLKKDIK